DPVVGPHRRLAAALRRGDHPGRLMLFGERVPDGLFINRPTVGGAAGCDELAHPPHSVRTSGAEQGGAAPPVVGEGAEFLPALPDGARPGDAGPDVDFI